MWGRLGGEAVRPPRSQVAGELRRGRPPASFRCRRGCAAPEPRIPSPESRIPESSSMRPLRYSVAASLDGYIAGPNGEFDWIPMDPDIDFAALYAGFSGIVMGRRSYEVYVSTGGGVGPALPVYVYSRTLPEGVRDGVTFVRDAVAHVPT